MADKSSNNFMLVKLELDYAESLVLSYADGIELLAKLSNARIFKQTYQEKSLCYDIRTGCVKSDILGAQEYGEATLRSTILGETNSEQ